MFRDVLGTVAMADHLPQLMSKSSKSTQKATNRTSKKPVKRIDKRDAVDGELVPETSNTKSPAFEQAGTAKTETKPVSVTESNPEQHQDSQKNSEKGAAVIPDAKPPTQTQVTKELKDQTMTQASGSTKASSSTQAAANESKLPLLATLLGALALAVGVYNWYQSNVVGFQTMGSQQNKLVLLDEKVTGISRSQQSISQAFEQNKTLLSQQFEQSKETLARKISDNQLAITGQLDAIKNRVADVQQGIGAQILDTKSALNSQVNMLEQQVLSGRGKLDLLINEAGHALEDKVESAGKQAKEQAEKFRTEYSSLATALGAMNRSFSASKQALALSEVGNLLTLADQRLRLSGDLVVASEALKLADAQLEKQQNDDFIELRKAINNDVNTLAAAPSVDVSGIVLKLTALSGAVAEWPLQADRANDTAAPARAPTDATAAEDGFLSLGKKLISEMVKVRRADAAKKPSFAPQERYFLSENFRLKLQAAQLGVLKEQQDAFSENIKSAAEWLQTHFDTGNASVANAINRLGEMADTKVTAERPAISTSLDAFTALESAQ